MKIAPGVTLEIVMLLLSLSTLHRYVFRPRNAKCAPKQPAEIPMKAVQLDPMNLFVMLIVRLQMLLIQVMQITQTLA